MKYWVEAYDTAHFVGKSQLNTSKFIWFNLVGVE